MIINQIKEAITTQSNKISQLEKDLLQTKNEKAELEKLETTEKMKYQQKISQAARLLKEAQIIAGCDQKNIINDVIEEMSIKPKEEKEDSQIEENPQPSDDDHILQVLNEQLEISTKLNNQLPEKEQIQNKKTLDSQPVPDFSEFNKVPIEKLELSKALQDKLKRYRTRKVGDIIAAFLFSKGRSLNVGAKGKEEIRAQLSKIFGIAFDDEFILTP